MVDRPRPDRPEDAIWSILRRLDKLETAAPLAATSVHDGQTRFVGALSILVQGSGQVTGTWIVSGRLEGSGQLDWTGPVWLHGDTSIEGNTTITGIARLLSDLIVEGDGRIILGNMILDPSINGGSVKFAGGPEVFADGGELDLYSTSGGAYIVLNGGAAEIHGPGVKWIRVHSGGFQFVGLPSADQADWPGSFPGAVVSDGSGNFYRIVP